MENRLIPAEQAVQTIEKFGLGDIIKPLVREIFLTDVPVRGVLFAESRLKAVKEGEELLLLRKKAPYDENLVAVFRGKERLGELSERDEEIFAHLLDAGKKLKARIKRVVVSPDYCALLLSIFLIDL